MKNTPRKTTAPQPSYRLSACVDEPWLVTRELSLEELELLARVWARHREINEAVDRAGYWPDFDWQYWGHNVTVLVDQGEVAEAQAELARAQAKVFEEGDMQVPDLF